MSGETEVQAPPPLTGGAAVLARLRRAAPAQPPPAVEETPPQLSGSAALLARMRRSRAVSGEPGAAPSTTGLDSAAAPSTNHGGFDGSFWLFYGGEASTQVAHDLATEARAHGLVAKVLPMDKFRDASLERCVPATSTCPRSARDNANSTCCNTQREAGGCVCGGDCGERTASRSCRRLRAALQPSPQGGW